MHPFKRKFANASLILLSLFYIIMLGGGNYEQLNVTTLVASAPPKSFAMMQGPYGFNPVKFWVTFRPLTILLFVLTLVSNWNYSPVRRKLILLSFVIDIAVIVATFSYFAPETEIFVSAPYSENQVDAALLERARFWENMNIIRLGAIYLSSLFLLIALNRTNTEIKSS